MTLEVKTRILPEPYTSLPLESHREMPERLPKASPSAPHTKSSRTSIFGKAAAWRNARRQ